MNRTRLFIGCALLLAGSFAGCGGPKGPVMGDRTSPAGRVEALTTARGLELHVNGLTKDILDSAGSTAHARYVAAMELPRQYFARTGNAFLAGIGSGAIYRSYHDAFWHITAAEPDSAMLLNAERSLGLAARDTGLRCEDGRANLETSDRKYDVILIDAVSPASLPERLLTKEFLALARTRLTNDGIVAIAVESAGWHDPFLASLGATVKEVFGEAVVLPITEPPNLFGSIVMLAMAAPRELVREPERNSLYEPDWRYGAEYVKTHAWDNKFAAETAGGIVFTDRTPRSLPLLVQHADSAGTRPADYLP